MHARVPHLSVKRIAGTFSAEIYGQLVALAVPLVQLPILLLGWGEKMYGEWLIFSAITLYLTTADFGYTYSAKNSMTIRAAAGDQEGALRVYQSVLVLLACIAAATLLSAVATLRHTAGERAAPNPPHPSPPMLGRSSCSSSAACFFITS